MESKTESNETEIKQENQTAPTPPIAGEGGLNDFEEIPIWHPTNTTKGRPAANKGLKQHHRPKSTHTLAQILKAIDDTGGLVREACLVMNMPVMTFYRKWRHKPEVAQALQEARNAGFEAVTDVLYTKCLDGDTKAISLYLQYNPLAKEKNWRKEESLTIKEEKPLSEAEKKDLVQSIFGEAENEKAKN